MDKINFVTGFQPDKPDFDSLQNSLESGLENVAAAVAGMGIKSGFDVSILGSEATASGGIGFDGLGRLLIKENPISVDLGGIVRPAAGKYRWVTLAARYKLTEEGQVIDINNQANPAKYLDDVEIEIVDTEADDIAENITKPSLTQYQVPLLDIRMDETSPWENLIKETTRKPDLIPVGDLPELIADKLIPVGHLYTQYPFMPTPDEHFGFGEWLNISTRAVGYGISDINSGDPTSYINRLDAGQALDFADADLAVDDQIIGGTYDGKYVRSVETYAGVFFAVEGGNRNSFEDALQESQNKQHNHSITVGSNTVAFGMPGPYNSTPYYTGLGDTGIASGTDGGITFSGGAEAQPNNRSIRIWIRRA